MSKLADPKVREALLLAEVAAWLHDDFKHTDAHIHKYVPGAPSPSGRQDTEDLIPNRSVALLGQTLLLADVRKRKKADFVRGYLNRCHYTAHIEKQDGDGPQKISWGLLGTQPFTGGERKALLEEIRALFARVGGDTRRPANEITLWEWGHTVGALYKAALAGALLGF